MTHTPDIAALEAARELAKRQKLLRVLQFWADGETRTYRSRDVEAFFDLWQMGYLEMWFDGRINDNVATITEQESP